MRVRHLFGGNIAAAIGIVLMCCATSTLRAQQQYVVLNDREVFLVNMNGTVSNAQLIDPVSKTFTSANPVIPPSGGSVWWDITFPGKVFTLALNPSTYVLAYQVDGKTTTLVISLSTKLTITASSAANGVRGYWLGSNVALTYNGGYLLDPEGQCPAPGAAGDWQAVSFTNKAKTMTISGERQLTIGTIADVHNNPERLGAVHLCLGYNLLRTMNNFTIDPASSASALVGIGVDASLPAIQIQYADAAAFNLRAAPSSKDTAQFYANLQIAAGTGAAGAWGLDGKVAMYSVPFLYRSWLTLVSATANTGNNTTNITGSTYTDTIDWTLPASRLFSLWGRKAPTSLTVTASPLYETDREFDKKNFLFSGDTLWSARKLYQPQNYRTIAKTGVMAKPGDPGYAKYGYELEFHAGVESGGTLLVTTAQNTKKTQSIEVPKYNIERVVPQIHGQYQQTIGSLGYLTLDSLIKSRYLFTSENTVRQSTSGVLALKEVSGWKALETFTGTWSPPQNTNVGITATYKNGFDAPKFSRVNSVLIGVLIQF
jgi:hypothetical protein